MNNDHRMTQPPQTNRQRGTALVVGLIMLVIMTLLAIASFQLGTVQTVVVSNALQQSQGVAAAQQAIETVINSSAYTKNPDQAIITSNCSGGGTNVLCVSSDGSSAVDFKVTLPVKPFCVSAAVILPAQLDLSTGATAPDLGCLSSTQQGQFGVSGTSSGSSMCANSVWEITAQAASTQNDTNVVTVAEGVKQRILTADMKNYCP
ncbi:MAG: hypothetical protein H7315_18225 [Herminiimonas sp.]|nr:hypothetical protein [Herminiimonas sp.]